MPRTDGVSTRVERRCILFRRSPISAWRWRKSRRIGEPTCSMVIVLSAMTTLPSRIARGVGGLDLAAALEHGDLETAARGDRAWRILAGQGIEGGANEVIGVRGAERLRDDVLDAERFEDGAHRAARDDAGAGRRRAQHHAARAM